MFQCCSLETSHPRLLPGNFFFFNGCTLKVPQALSSQTKFFLLHKAWPCNESLTFETFSPSIPFLVLGSIHSALEVVNPSVLSWFSCWASWHTPALPSLPSFLVNEPTKGPTGTAESKPNTASCYLDPLVLQEHPWLRFCSKQLGGAGPDVCTCVKGVPMQGSHWAPGCRFKLQREAIEHFAFVFVSLEQGTVLES